VRALFFSNEQSLGQRQLALTRQSADAAFAKFRENARWVQGEVVFVTVHAVGSNNNPSVVRFDGVERGPGT
jgi:hypothetical protein